MWNSCPRDGRYGTHRLEQGPGGDHPLSRVSTASARRMSSGLGSRLARLGQGRCAPPAPLADAQPLRSMTSQTSRIAQLLETARQSLDRVEPGVLAAAVADGALVVDIRPESNRREEGELPGAVVVERVHLEWRLDPTGPGCIPEAAPGRRVVIVCNEGFSRPSLRSRCARSAWMPPTWSAATGRCRASSAAGGPARRPGQAARGVRAGDASRLRRGHRGNARPPGSTAPGPRSTASDRCPGSRPLERLAGGQPGPAPQPAGTAGPDRRPRTAPGR
jgi:hypothetical protein